MSANHSKPANEAVDVSLETREYVIHDRDGQPTFVMDASNSTWGTLVRAQINEGLKVALGENHHLGSVDIHLHY